MQRFINAHERTGDNDAMQMEIKRALLAGHSVNEPHFKQLILWLKKGKLVGAPSVAA